jgi:hypothetical protein
LFWCPASAPGCPFGLEPLWGDKEKGAVRRVRVSELFNRPIQSQDDLDSALQQLREALQKYIDEGASIILE